MDIKSLIRKIEERADAKKSAEVYKAASKVKLPKGVKQEDIAKGKIAAFQGDKKDLLVLTKLMQKELGKKFGDLKVTVAHKDAPKMDSGEEYINISRIIDRKASDPDDDVDQDTSEFKVQLMKA